MAAITARLRPMRSASTPKMMPPSEEESKATVANSPALYRVRIRTLPVRREWPSSR